jgi:hypothetical protein
MSTENQSSDSDESTALDTIGATIGSVITGIAVTEPVQRNAIKAFGRLCSALVEVPVAALEGVAAEIRAESQARVKLISATADQLVAQLKVDPQLAEAASNRYGARIVRQQVNLNRVSAIALDELKAKSAKSGDVREGAEGVAVDEIDTDWLNVFETEASEKSSEQMQMLFGKILAGEVQRPKSFSIKTLRLISQLETNTAQLFKHLCSLSISLQAPDVHLLDVRVCSLGGNAASNALQSYGLSFDQLNVLQEFGLVISDYNSYAGYGSCIAHQHKIGLPLMFEGRPYGLVPKTESQLGQDFLIHGVALSRAGRELFPIVDIEPDEHFRKALQDFFDKSGFTMQMVGSAT